MTLQYLQKIIYVCVVIFDVNWITQLKSPCVRDKYVQFVQLSNCGLNFPVLAVLPYLYTTALLT